MRAQQVVVIDEIDSASVAADMPAGSEKPKKFGHLLSAHAPFLRRWHVGREGQFVSWFNLRCRDLVEAGVEHIVMRSHIDDPASSVNRDRGMIGVALPQACCRHGPYPGPSFTVPHFQYRAGGETLS